MAGVQRARDDRTAAACPIHIVSLTNPRLVPANARVEDGHAHGLQRLRHRLDLFSGAPALHQVQQAEAEDYDIIRAARLPRVPHDLHRQPYPVREAVAAVLVVCLVRLGREELVDEVTLAVHDLDLVAPRVAGQDGAADQVADSSPHARGGQRPGKKGGMGL